MKIAVCIAKLDEDCGLYSESDRSAKNPTGVAFIIPGQGDLRNVKI